MPITVVIADDHPMVIDGISAILRNNPDIQVLAACGTGGSLLATLEQQQPDVLLIDINFPDTTGNELVRIISAKYPSVRVLAVTSVDNPFQIVDMMRHGCSGYVIKNASAATLLEAIDTVYNGGEFLAPGLKELVFESVINPGKQKSGLIRLTKREEEILNMICDGMTNYEIGERLFLSHRTIENHRTVLYTKFGVNNTAKMVRAAIQKGFVK